MSSDSRSGSSRSTSSRVSPLASRSRTSETRIRIPRTHGRPPHCSWFTVIRSSKTAMRSEYESHSSSVNAILPGFKGAHSRNRGVNESVPGAAPPAPIARPDSLDSWSRLVRQKASLVGDSVHARSAQKAQWEDRRRYSSYFGAPRIIRMVLRPRRPNAPVIPPADRCRATRRYCVSL